MSGNVWTAAQQLSQLDPQAVVAAATTLRDRAQELNPAADQVQSSVPDTGSYRGRSAEALGDRVVSDVRGFGNQHTGLTLGSTALTDYANVGSKAQAVARQSLAEGQSMRTYYNQWASVLSRPVTPQVAALGRQQLTLAANRYQTAANNAAGAVSSVQTGAGDLRSKLDNAKTYLLAQNNFGTDIPGNYPPEVKREILRRRQGPQPYTPPLIPDFTKMTPQQQLDWVRKNGVNVLHRYATVLGKDAQQIIGNGERAIYYTLNKHLTLPAAERNLQMQMYANMIAATQNKLSPQQNAALQKQIAYNAARGRDAAQRAFELGEASANYQQFVNWNGAIDGLNQSNEAKYQGALAGQQATAADTSNDLGQPQAAAAFTNQVLVPIEQGRFPRELAAEVSSKLHQGWSPKKIMTWLYAEHPKALDPRYGSTVPTGADPGKVPPIPTGQQVVGNWLEKPPEPPKVPLLGEQQVAALNAAEQARLNLAQTPSAQVTVPPDLTNPNFPKVPDIPRPTWKYGDTYEYAMTEKHRLEALSATDGAVTAIPPVTLFKRGLEANPLLNKLTTNPVDVAGAVNYGNDINWLFSDGGAIIAHQAHEGMTQAYNGAKNTFDGATIAGQNLGVSAVNNADITQAGIEQTAGNGISGSLSAEQRARQNRDFSAALQSVGQQYDAQLQQTDAANSATLVEKKSSGTTQVETSNLFSVTQNLPRFESAHPGSTNVIRAVMNQHPLSGSQVVMDAIRQVYDAKYGQGEFLRIYNGAAAPLAVPSGQPGMSVPIPANQFTQEDLDRLNRQILEQNQRR